jgi:hypothetical protein
MEDRVEGTQKSVETKDEWIGKKLTTYLVTLPSMIMLMVMQQTGYSLVTVLHYAMELLTIICLCFSLGLHLNKS